MSKQRHRQRNQGGTTTETRPQTGSGVAQFSVSEVAQFSMSLDNPLAVLLRTEVRRASDQDSWRRIAGMTGGFGSPVWARCGQNYPNLTGQRHPAPVRTIATTGEAFQGLTP